MTDIPGSRIKEAGGSIKNSVSSLPFFNHQFHAEGNPPFQRLGQLIGIGAQCGKNSRHIGVMAADEGKFPAVFHFPLHHTDQRHRHVTGSMGLPIEENSEIIFNAADFFPIFQRSWCGQRQLPCHLPFHNSGLKGSLPGNGPFSGIPSSSASRRSSW